MFEIKPTKSYKKTNIDLFSKNGTIPVVTNSSINNGITGYSELLATEKGNKITYSDTTTSEGIFYQPRDFIGYSHIQGLYPKIYNEKWNYKTLIYIVVLFKRVAAGRFNYGNKFNRNIAKEFIIKLPIKNGEIDFDFMEDFIAELEAQRIAQLEAYLLATGLKDTQLSLKEEQALKHYELNQKEDKAISELTNNSEYITWINIPLSNLFLVKSSEKRFDANKVTFKSEGNPYVARGSNNNGIKGLIKEDEKYLNKGNTLSFGQDTATIFYQEKDYFTGDKIKVLYPKENFLNRLTGLFFATSIASSFKSFSWGSSSFNENIIKQQHICVPIFNGDIDCEYMETLISAIQKLVIKDVVEYSDRKIKATKKVINNSN